MTGIETLTQTVQQEAEYRVPSMVLARAMTHPAFPCSIRRLLLPENEVSLPYLAVKTVDTDFSISAGNNEIDNVFGDDGFEFVDGAFFDGHAVRFPHDARNPNQLLIVVPQVVSGHREITMGDLFRAYSYIALSDVSTKNPRAAYLTLYRGMPDLSDGETRAVTDIFNGTAGDPYNLSTHFPEVIPNTRYYVYDVENPITEPYELAAELKMPPSKIRLAPNTHSDG